MSKDYKPLHWTEVKNLPEGARVQNDKKACVTTVFFPFYFRDETGKAKQERDYIGTVEDGAFVPNLYYVQNQPTKDNRPPERWHDPIQRQKAFDRLHEAQQVLESSAWAKLELKTAGDITRQIGLSSLCAKILYEEGLVQDVADVLEFSLSDTLNVLNLAVSSALVCPAVGFSPAEINGCKFFGSGCLPLSHIPDFLTKIGSRPHLFTALNAVRNRRAQKQSGSVSFAGSCEVVNSSTVSSQPYEHAWNAVAAHDFLLECSSTSRLLGFRLSRKVQGEEGALAVNRSVVDCAGVAAKTTEFIFGEQGLDSNGFFELDRSDLRFISEVSVEHHAVKSVIESHRQKLRSPSALLLRHDCYGLKFPVSLSSGQRASLCVFFNPKARMSATRALREKLAKTNEDWLKGNLGASSPAMSFFTVPEKGKPLIIDTSAFEAACSLYGFSACITIMEDDPDTVLERILVRRQIEENIRSVVRQLLAHTEEPSEASMAGAFFVAFIAESILLRLNRALPQADADCRNISGSPSACLEDEGMSENGGCETIKELVHTVAGITATVSARSGKVMLNNVSARAEDFAKSLGFSGFYQSADAVWHLLSARHMDDVIRKVKADKGLSGEQRAA